MKAFDSLRNNRWRIATRILVYVTPFLIIAALVVGLLAFIGPTAQLYRRQVSDQTSQLTNLFGQKVGTLMAFRLHSLMELSLDLQLVNTATERNTAYAGLSAADADARLAEQAGQWERGGALTESILNNPATTRLHSFLTANGGFSEMLVTDRYGAVIASTSDALAYNNSGEAWFTTALSGTPYLSAPDAADPGEAAILIALPLTDLTSGELEGTVLAIYPVAALASEISVPELEGVGIERIVDAAGQVVVSPNADELGKAYAPAVAVAQAGGFATSGSILEAVDANGREVVASYGPITSSGLAEEIDMAGMAVWVEVDRSLYFTAIEQNRNTTLLNTTVTMVLLVAIVIVVTRYATRDLRTLTRTVEHFAQGDLSQRALTQGAGEVHDLATAFNQMAAELERDIQQLQTSENASRAQNEALIKANRELALARKQAEAANALKSQFLATMSHELRTPLNAIIGYTQLQLAGMVGELNDELRGFQERIFINAQHLLHLINDVLDLSKIESGRLDLIERPYNLRDCIDEVLTQSRVLAEDKGLKLIVKEDERLPEILMGDRGRVKQVLMNLISNGIKFTDTGSVTVETVRQDDHTFRLSVTDTGVGIPSHLQQTVFDEFRQADEGLQRGGTGLGLAIVRRLVLMMNGSIRLSSEVGKGSTFTVTLPLIETLPDGVILTANGSVEA
jgi:signal transduction histidine kinase